MNSEDMEFLTNLDKILSFVDLQKIYETWIKDGTIYEKVRLLQFGYLSLISHPAIFLTKDGAYEELKAAKVCHDIWVKYDKEEIEKKINGTDEKISVATKIVVLPPNIYLLHKIDRFFLLHYLLVGMFKETTDSELSQINGDLYAKTWLTILDQGYKDEMTEAYYNNDCAHLYDSLRIIRKMKLSDEYVKKLSEESVKAKFKNYLNLGGGGCMVTLLMVLGSLSSLTACLGLIFGFL